MVGFMEVTNMLSVKLDELILGKYLLKQGKKPLLPAESSSIHLGYTWFTTTMAST